MATGEMVTVMCKLPLGLHLDVYETKEVTQPDGTVMPMRGARRRVTVRGNAEKRGMDLQGATDVKQLHGGYAMTQVPADHWEAWLAQHQQFGPVVAGLIFAAAKPMNAQAQAKDQAELRSGFEPLNPDDKKHGIRPLVRDEAA